MDSEADNNTFRNRYRSHQMLTNHALALPERECLNYHVILKMQNYCH